MVLTVAGIVVKILGGVNRILLSRLLGGEGIGLYQMAYPMYILLLSIVGAGIPSAVSIMVAEQAARGNYSGTRQIFHVTLAFMAVIALLCGLGMVLGARALIATGLVSDERAYWPLVVLAPALSLSVLTCCFRGYFQGLQLMTPTALSQMVDQFIRVCVMLTLAWILLPYGLVPAASGAAFGAVPGAAAGLCVIAVLYIRHEKKERLADEGTFVPLRALSVIKRLIVLAVPVAAANMLLPAVASIDLFIVPRRLIAAGYTGHEATALFGYLSGMANGLVQLPAILTMALATSLVPAVSAACASGRGDLVLARTHTAMRIACVITIPASLGLAVLAVPISRLLIGLQQVTGGLLQGLGHTAIPLYNMAAAAVVKIALSWYLTALPWLAEVGAAWATNADLAIAAALNLYFARRYCQYTVQWLYIGKLFLAAAAMAGTAWFVHKGLSAVTPDALATVAAMGVAALIYLICLFAFRAVDADDVVKVPVVGHRMYQWVKRLEK